jgi:hypothetical protein
MTLNIWGFGKAQGRSIAGYLTTERSEIANPAGLPGGCERGEQQTRNAAKTSKIRRSSRLSKADISITLKNNH